MACTSDEKLFRLLETEPFEEHLDEIIEGALRIKRGVVEQDEKETGLRKMLNFGHTVGHGIECTVTPALYHGECVALGMLPMCSDAVRERLLGILGRVGLPTAFHPDLDAVLDAVTHDKKRTADGVDAVTVEEVGKGRIVRMTLEELRARAERCYQ